MNRLIVVVVSVACWATTAGAQPSPADAAFKRGRELLKAGKYADACVEFEHSQRLDPALGTEFNIAQCSEKIGKLAYALALYRNMLPRDTNAERKRVVTEAIPLLEARVPKLVIQVATPPPAGLAITIQTTRRTAEPREIEANQPIELDFGEYRIVGKATGAPDWTQTTRIETEAKTTTLVAPFAPAATRTTDPERGPDPGPPPSRRKLYSIVALAAGGAALVTGIVFGSLASSKWSEAKDVCGGTTCTNTADLATANELGDNALGKATLSTVFVIAGTAAAVTGVVLLVTTPKTVSETRVTAHPTDRGAALTVFGRF